MGLVCLDLDGTLVENRIEEVEEGGKSKLQRAQHDFYSQPVLLPNRLEVIECAAAEGDRFAIVTNQGGVAWGYHTVAEVEHRIGFAVAQLAFFFAQPFSIHIAYEHPKATISKFRGEDQRKPAPTLILDALTAHGDSINSWPAAETLMVGDDEGDRLAAEAAGVDFAAAAEFFEL